MTTSELVALVTVCTGAIGTGLGLIARAMWGVGKELIASQKETTAAVAAVETKVVVLTAVVNTALDLTPVEVPVVGNHGEYHIPRKKKTS